MSDSMSAATETALPQEVAPAAAVSAGALLRQARQAQGVALEDLAATLKVPLLCLRDLGLTLSALTAA